MLGCFQCNPHQSLAIYFQAGNRFKDINTEESGDAMILNVCVTDTPETAVFHLVCLEDKEMNSIIPRKMPDIVIMSHISVSEMFFFKAVLGWHCADAVQICQPSYSQQASFMYVYLFRY